MAPEPEAKATSEKTTSGLKQKLEQRIDEAKKRLDDLRQDLADVRHEDEESVRKMATEIQQRLESQQKRAQEVRDQVSTWLRDKKQEGEEQVRTWREKREIKRLERRADRAEDYAVNALVITMMDVDEAELAVLDALQARLDAQRAQLTT